MDNLKFNSATGLRKEKVPYNRATGISGLLDNLIGEEGLKTDITLTLGPDIYVKLGATIIIAGTVVLGINYLLKEMIKK
ncbi:MAG: hypothetical protein WCT85_00645 [Parachlamydiales bacterium]|jgi:hypothetical protein